MVKRRRTATRSWSRGVFAFFWIVLAGASGLYLFTLFTDPEALGGQAVRSSAISGDEMATETAPAVPVPEASTDESAEVTKLKGTIRALSQQVATLDARLKPIEKFIGPVAALPPSASVTTSLPDTPLPAQAEAAAAADPAQEPEAAVEEAPVEDEAAEEAPGPPGPAQMAAAAPMRQPAPKPEPQAPAAQAMPEPEAAEPPAVAEAPMENDEGAPEENAAPNAPETPAAPSEQVNIAAYDPVELPPAANDGSTRYGIEIGTVGKRDELRPLWREFLTKHAALVAGLQPRCVLAPDKKWRLVAGPFANAQDAEGACSLFKKADRPCSATVYAGDAL
jgi:hypothetical protein